LAIRAASFAGPAADPETALRTWATSALEEVCRVSPAHRHALGLGELDRGGEADVGLRGRQHQPDCHRRAVPHGSRRPCRFWKLVSTVRRAWPPAFSSAATILAGADRDRASGGPRLHLQAQDNLGRRKISITSSSSSMRWPPLPFRISFARSAQIVRAHRAVAVGRAVERLVMDHEPSLRRARDDVEL